MPLNAYLFNQETIRSNDLEPIHDICGVLLVPFSPLDAMWNRLLAK